MWNHICSFQVTIEYLKNWRAWFLHVKLYNPWKKSWSFMYLKTITKHNKHFSTKCIFLLKHSPKIMSECISMLHTRWTNNCLWQYLYGSWCSWTVHRKKMKMGIGKKHALAIFAWKTITISISCPIIAVL